MKLLATLLATLALTGCASGCHTACVFGFGPGNPVFDSVALAHDRADECQEGTTPERKQQLGRPEGYKRPDWCFDSMGRRTNIYNKNGHRIGYLR